LSGTDESWLRGVFEKERVMPLDGLIPIGGATGGSGGSKRGGAGDLTSGLISISGARDNVDVDMSDFDVGDLLGDDSGKSKATSKDKSDGKKKKKAKSSGSSKKKGKSKKKSAFDDDDFGDDSRAADDWNSSAKNWDSTAEMEMAAARRKNGSGKAGGGLDDEFAKMLGFDSGVGGSGADVTSPEPPPLSPSLGLTRDDSDDAFGVSGYTPTVRGSKKAEADDSTPPLEADEAATRGRGGLSAAFFQDDDKGDQGLSSLSSLLGPTTERRGGHRGGRRQTGGAEADVLGAPAAPTSTFDALFGSSSRRTSPLDDPFAKPARNPLEEEEPRQQRSVDVVEESKTAEQPGPFASARDAAPTAQRSAKDDLLADLFAPEPRSSRSSRRPETVAGDLEPNANVDAVSEPAPTAPEAVDPAKQQTDLLADLFATSSSRTKAYETPKGEAAAKPSVVEVKAPTPPKEKAPAQEKVEAPTDLASARDSLLMDLLGDLSPPKPLLSRRRSRSNTSFPEKEAVEAADPFKSSLSPTSPAPSQPLATVPELPAATPAASERPVTPPSPGRRRSLTVDKGALAIRESDFEQSKDSLLEEILPSPSASAHSSPHRCHSYSQSFDVEDSLVAEEHKEAQVPEEPQAPDAPLASPPQPERQVEPAKPPKNHDDVKTPVAPACNCVEREEKLTAAFSTERAELQLKIDELVHQLETQEASSIQLKRQLSQQREERDAAANRLLQELEEHRGSASHLTQQLEARTAANAQLTQQLATSEREKRQADQFAATSKDDAAGFRHRAELLESEVRGLREELSRSKRAVQDAELALARQTAEREEGDQLERHREKRGLEALSAQMQRALARLTISHQVQEEGSGYESSPARVAAEDEARLRVIASLEGSSKRAAQHAEQERLKLAELLRELEAGARNARQGSLEDKERLRQEQQRLDALSAHLQAQSAALREQEAAHAVYMGQQLAEAREDARVYEARLATRRTQLERDERALYEARAEFAAFREQTSLEIEREYEELRVSRLRLEGAWRELRADREDLEAELASHEGEFQELESLRLHVQQAEAQLAARTQQVVALAETLDAGTQDLLAREQLVAQQAAVVQDTDSSFVNRERALERVKNELETREHRLHVQIRQLDSARGRLTQQRLEQQQLMSAARRHYPTPAKVPVDNNKPWRHSVVQSSRQPTPTAAKAWQTEPHLEEDPSGLTPALRKQVEAHWQRREQQAGHRSKGSFDLGDFHAHPSCWATSSRDAEAPSYSSKSNSATEVGNVESCPHKSSDTLKAPPQSTRPHLPPPPPTRSPSSAQPTLRVNL
jgi:hypothetical protein